jgi:NAD(P)H-dependent FMN reductase
MKILALCGSIRPHSSNHAVLLTAKKLIAHSAEWVDFQIKDLPYFDPQLQFDNVPEVVSALRRIAFESEYIFISTPEYAHGIPGVLKNALEWLICEETMQKKVFIFIATSSGGEFVKDYLLETLRTMDLQASVDSTLIIPNARKGISPTGEMLDSNLEKTMRQFLREFRN